eukprot:NODE_21_length_42443_cov_0.822808.p18 type:complete len:262 gc:universal NODE_21_length_42443_cov_0.822808:5793-6578(+)
MKHLILITCKYEGGSLIRIEHEALYFCALLINLSCKNHSVLQMVSHVIQIYLALIHLAILFLLFDLHHVFYPIDINLTRVGRLFDASIFSKESLLATSKLHSQSNWPKYIHTTRPLWSSIDEIVLHKHPEYFIQKHYPHLFHLYNHASKQLQEPIANILYTMHFGGLYYINISSISEHDKISRFKVNSLHSPIIIYTINRKLTAILSRPDESFWKFVVQLVNMRVPVWKYQNLDFLVGGSMIRDAVRLYEENGGYIEWVHI